MPENVFQPQVLFLDNCFEDHQTPVLLAAGIFKHPRVFK